jgi:hypothetical protein
MRNQNKKNKNPLYEKQKKYNVVKQGINILDEKPETKWFSGDISLCVKICHSF